MSLAQAQAQQDAEARRKALLADLQRAKDLRAQQDAGTRGLDSDDDMSSFYSSTQGPFVFLLI